MSQPDFTVDVAQNEFLPEGGDDVNAIVTVTSPAVTSTDMASPGAASPTTGPAAPAGDAGIAEVIIIDCSGSMRYPQTKIAEARAATAAAVALRRARVPFAAVPGTQRAHPLVPPDGALA